MLQTSSEDHAAKPSRLNNLGSSLVCRKRHIRELVDIDTAISVHEDAVCLIPEDRASGLN